MMRTSEELLAEVLLTAESEARRIFFRRVIFPVLKRHSLMNRRERDEYLEMMKRRTDFSEEIWQGRLLVYHRYKNRAVAPNKAW